jgi:ferrous iron transport protein A
MLIASAPVASAIEEPTVSSSATVCAVAPRSLLSLKRFEPATVQAVITAQGPGIDLVARRLNELGFVPGEPVKVVAFGPLGADPILVQIGFTRFALRRAEAARVQVA